MHCDPIVLSPLVNGISYAKTMVDTGCLCYGLCDPAFVRKADLKRVEIKPFYMEAFDGEKAKRPIKEAVAVNMDLEGHMERVWCYVTPLGGYDMYLGMPWIRKKEVRIDKGGKRLRIGRSTVRSEETFNEETARISSARLVSAVSWNHLRTRKKRSAQVFAASMADINKALQVKKPTDPKTRLPPHLHQFLDVFSREASDKLPPFRGPSVDNKIELEKDDQGKERAVPWGPLYNMSRDELLVLRKTLSELLDKGFIRVSNSPAAAPILFVKKPGGGLRFCVDYRALNKITRKDRYPLPLIQETLRNLSESVVFTKLDVIAAFHRIRVAKGDEWKTAFRSRFGSYEWLVTPFGLANAPSTFQRYINWVLRDILDDFCSAYIDDIIIYSKDRKQHQKHVEEVLQRLRDAGLQCDIDKSEFEVESTKYLGFIIEAGKGIRMDPEKVKAIQEWQAPTTVKGVRGFLGFANFYRRFIEHYSDVVRPLTELTHKDTTFQWNDDADRAFHQLKRVFLAGPALAQFDFEKPTRVETDSSGWCIGATMMQPNDDGLYVPCAFFSKKLNSAECNYEIYDKEMLAIVRSLEEWDAELRSVKRFEVFSDHKNLEYFMTVRKLTERQMRWSLTLARFNFQIVHVSGVNNERADALSRRDQDMPKDSQDDRLMERHVQLIKPEWIAQGRMRVSALSRARVDDMSPPGDEMTKKSNTPRVAPVTRSQSNPRLVPEDTQSRTKGAPRRSHEQESNLSSLTAPRVTLEAALEKMENGSAGPQGDSANHATPLAVGEEHHLMKLWPKAVKDDPEYLQALDAVRKEKRKFPADLRLKVSIAECNTSPTGKLMYRDRVWVPKTRNLRTQVLQEIHDSAVHVHPGREVMYAIVARQFYWPGIAREVRTFVENCDECGSNKAWRTLRHGFLKPLPIPDRVWSEISMDFITGLPISEGCSNMVVITDRLSKGVVADGLEDIETETVAKWFLRRYYPHHFLPKAIVSDRGAQFTGAFWKRLCDTLKIRRRLSTAFAPETDGSTERANEVIETTLRQLVNWAQEDWMEWLQVGVGAICGRNASSIGISPFFMTHGWNQEVFSFDFKDTHVRKSPVSRAEQVLQKLKDVRQLAETAMASAQEAQETAANRRRMQAPVYRVGDKVWLSLENIQTDRPSKKLDQRYAKFEILEVKGSHTYKLNVPPGVHDVFPTRLLRPVRSNPLPGQRLHEPQPVGIVLNKEVKYEVDEILDEKKGRGGVQKYLVRWIGYKKPTWEPHDFVKDLLALDRWEEKKRNGHVSQGGLVRERRRRRVM